MSKVTYIEKDSGQPNVRFIEIHLSSAKPDMTPDEIAKAVDELRVLLQPNRES